jgi:quercetin dioxygenase-like cupin family protein
MQTLPQFRASRAWLLTGLTILLALGALIWSTRLADTREAVTSLLATSKTVLGQEIAYPAKTPAKVTAVLVEMQPGETTGWHAHDVPMFGYILEGEVTVDYGAKGTRVYRAGDAVMEAIDFAHNGRNSGKGVTRILAVFMGADGVPNTVKVATPK